MGRGLEYCRGRQVLEVGGRGWQTQILVNPDCAEALGSNGLRGRGCWGTTAQVRDGFGVCSRRRRNTRRIRRAFGEYLGGTSECICSWFFEQGLVTTTKTKESSPTVPENNVMKNYSTILDSGGFNTDEASPGHFERNKTSMGKMFVRNLLWRSR